MGWKFQHFANYHALTNLINHPTHELITKQIQKSNAKMILC